MQDIDPPYYKDFIYLYIRGRKCIYAEAKKNIYGTLEALLIFWKKLTMSLDKEVYQIN